MKLNTWVLTWMVLSGLVASSNPAQAGSNVCEIQSGNTRSTVNQIIGSIPEGIVSFSTDAEKVSIINGHATPFRLPNSLEGNSLAIYFITNQAALDEWDIADLDAYAEDIKKLEGNITLVLEWFADARGTEKRNDYLSEQRAKNIRDYLQGILWNKVQFQIVANGETKSEEKPARTREERLQLRPDRRVTITPTNNVISTWLQRSPADIYLLDASGSMAGEKWKAVSSFDFPKAARVFTFNTENAFECPTTFENQRVDWGTPLYKSALEVIQNPESHGKTLTILTDGQDTEGGAYYTDIIEAAQKNNVTINVIWIESYDEDTLKRIAEGTGGKFYLER